MSSTHFERRRGRQSFASISKLIGYLFWTKQAGNHLDECYINFDRYQRDPKQKMEEFVLKFEKLYNRIKQRD